MSVSTGSIAGRRRAGRFRFVLFSMLVLFGGGFYAGVQATKRVTASDSGILHRIFGIQPPIIPVAAAAPAAPAQPVKQAPAAPPVAANPAPQAPADAPKASEASAAPKPDNNAAQSPAAPDPADKPGSEKDAAALGTPAEQAQLASQVTDYNDMLQRIQKALASYSTVHQKSLAPKTKAQDLKLLLDQENGLVSEITSAAKHAQNILVALEGNSNFPALYSSGAACANRKDIPSSLLDLDLDKLKVIEKAQ